ncbi:uncharacterized protein LOC105848862 isoform X1 [Hydra vulgaris]|uniref:uncharacterized protein LOC105848862 isoform X1 n=1 Tax=Hydra vulgaris TaxID=6087 RepID=UPI001F5FB2A8|nr:uncharacterized protein LOC105848862 isoform X1 [Hydra vulgaris]
MESKSYFVYLVFGRKKISSLMFKLVRSLDNDYKVMILYCNHMHNTTLDTLHMCRRFLFADNALSSYNFNEFYTDCVSHSLCSDNNNPAIILNICLQDDCLFQFKSLCCLLPAHLKLYVFVEFCEKQYAIMNIEDFFPTALWRFWTNCLVNSYLDSPVQVAIRDISELDYGITFWGYVAQLLLKEIFLKLNSEKNDGSSTKISVFVTETQIQAAAVYDNILRFFNELQLYFESSIVFISSLVQPKFSCQTLAVITCKEIFFNIPLFACKHLILYHSVHCYTEWIQLKKKAKKAERCTVISDNDEKFKLFNRIDEELRCKMNTMTPHKRNSMKNLRNEISYDFSILPENLLQVNSNIKTEDLQIASEDLNTKDKHHTYVYVVSFSDSKTKESDLIGLCVNAPLPFIFPFVLFDHYQPNNVKIKFGFEYNMKSSEMELIKKFMHFIFHAVLKMTVMSYDGYLCVLLHLENGVHKIDFNKMSSMIAAQMNLCETKINLLKNRQGFKTYDRNIYEVTNKTNEIKIVENICNNTLKVSLNGPSCLTDCVKSCHHMLENKDIRIKKFYEKHYNTLFIQIHVSKECFFHLDRAKSEKTILASDPFPDNSKAVSYKEYFMKRYNLFINDDDLMAPLNYFKPKFNALNKKVSNKKRTIIYLPLSFLCPVDFIGLGLLCCFCLMPSVVFYIKLNLNVFHIHSSINNFSKEKCFSLDYFTHEECDISLTLGTAPNNVSSNKSVYSESQSEDILKTHHFFLQSLVAANAALDINNDLLEFLGDSVLKYIITAELHLAFPGVKSTQLVFYRNKILSNKYLSELGFLRHMDKIIIFEIFEPAKAFSSNNSSKIRTILEKLSLNDANERLLANVVEAFIGACFLTLPQDSLYNVFRYFGFNIMKLSLLHKNGYYRANYPLECASFKRVEAFKSLELKLGYKFQNPTLYFNACLHHSYADVLYLNGKKNEFDIDAAIKLGTNECLELIGDAVLDILVTKEIFSRNNISGANKSGNLSFIRSAIVNTYTFSVLATDLELHKHLIFSSYKLSQKIIDWLNVFEEMKKTGNLYNKATFNSFVAFHNNQFVEVPKELANIYEAIAGAVYLDTDGNLDEVWRVFFPFMKSLIDFVYNTIPQSILQLLSEAHPDVSFKELPPQVNGEYTCVMSYDKEEFVATAKSYRIAKSILAVKVFEKLKNSSV